MTSTRSSNGGTRTLMRLMSALAVAAPLVGGAAAFMQQQISNSKEILMARIETDRQSFQQRFDALDKARIVEWNDDYKRMDLVEQRVRALETSTASEWSRVASHMAENETQIAALILRIAQSANEIADIREKLHDLALMEAGR